MKNKDARGVLQEEVQESVLRLQKAKFGHKLNDIVPDHKKNFYMPDKRLYLPKAKPNYSNSQSNYSQHSISNQNSQIKIFRQNGPNKYNADDSPQVGRYNKKAARNPKHLSNSIDQSSSFMTEPPAQMFLNSYQVNPQMNQSNQFAQKAGQSSGMRFAQGAKNTMKSAIRSSHLQDSTQDTSALRSTNVNNFMAKPHANSNSKMTEYMDTFRIGGGSVVSGNTTHKTQRQTLMN